MLRSDTRSAARPIALLAAALVPIVVLTACSHPTRAQHDLDRGWLTFGDAGAPSARGSDPEITVSQAQEYSDSGRRVVLSGTIDQVCRTMGCWLDIRDDAGRTIRVMNKDHGFFVPRNARGRAVHAIGFVTTRELSVDTLKHLAEDAGRPAEEIAAITAPETVPLFIADAVLIPTGGLEAPATAGGAQ